MRSFAALFTVTVNTVKSLLAGKQTVKQWSIIHNVSTESGVLRWNGKSSGWLLWACFLTLARSKLRLCSANHMPGYWSSLPCVWQAQTELILSKGQKTGPGRHGTCWRQTSSAVTRRAGTLTTLPCLCGYCPENMVIRSHIHDCLCIGIMTPYGDRDLGQHWLR